MFNCINILVICIVLYILALPMKIHYELVKPDDNSSIRFLYQKLAIKDHFWEYHYHPEYELVCVFEGSGTRHVGTHLSAYENGDLVLIGSNVPHSGFGLNANDPHVEIVVQIHPDVLSETLGLPEMKELAALLKQSTKGIRFLRPTQEKVKKMLIGMINMKPFDRLIEFIRILRYLSTTADYEVLNNQEIVDNVNKHQSRLQKIFSYVELHYKNEIEISDVADLVNISVPSFCNYFKKTTQITFTEFVNRYRIQKACVLLIDDKTIAGVCFECGFNNVTYFNKIFKRIMGKTPSEFKNEYYLLDKGRVLLNEQPVTILPKNRLSASPH